MAEKALYVLAGYDDETEERLSKIQNKLYELGFSGVQTKDIPMHFTLGSFDVEREEELKTRLEELAKTQKSFDASFNHVGLFRLPQNDVLFIAPEVSREMLNLKDSFLDNKDIFPWSAHTTMLIDKADIIQEALKTVMSEFTAFTGKVEKLYLYEFWPARLVLTVSFDEANGVN